MLKIFEGKSPTERNKIIAVSVLGVMATLALFNLFVGFSPSPKKSVTVKISPSPTVSPKQNIDVVSMPSQDDMIRVYQSTPIFYNPGNFYAPDAGRNIFAFYEPPVPTPYIAPPPVIKTPTPLPLPVPAPTPPQLIAFISPQSVYAGSKGFRLEVNGDKFTPDSVIIFNGNQLPTTFVSEQKLYADVPSNFISGEGTAQITVATPDGRLFSNPFQFTVQAPPRPGFRYVGMIARKYANNDTAYFEETGKPMPFGARLNDVVVGRFRLASISASEVVFEDVNLGFRHKLALYRPASGAGGAPTDNRNNPNGTFNQYNQITPTYNAPPNQGEIPGIPSNIPRYVPPQPANPTPQPPLDDDDDGDGEND